MARREKKRPTFAEVWQQACREGKAPITRWEGPGGRGIRKYEYKLMTGESAVRSDGNFREQARNYRAAREHSDLIRARVHSILQAHEVMLIRYITYYNFSGRVDYLVRNFGGETLRQWVEMAVLDWRDRGCDPAVLKDILTDVFRMGEVGE